MPETCSRSQRVKFPTGQRLATRPEPSLAATRVAEWLMRRQEVNGPMETSPENANIVDAQALMVAEGSNDTPAKARACKPPGCVTLARAQEIGGNLGDPRVSRTGQREASKSIGRGGAHEQTTGTRSASAVAGLAGNKTAVSSSTEVLDLVGMREGNRSVSRRSGGVGASQNTDEAGEVAGATTLWREGDSKGLLQEAGVINSVRPGTTFPAHRG